MAEEVDPQLQPILDIVEQTPGLDEVGVETARDLFDSVATFTPDHEVYEEVDTTIPGADGDLDARIYRPGEGDRPVLVYLHGGGFVVGGLDTHDNVCQKLAEESGWTVVSVDYRLAPEHPFPAALEDAYAAVEWIAENPEEVGGNGTIAVGGDSAGGNLTIGVTLLARDADPDFPMVDAEGPDIAHQVLFYPVTAAPYHDHESRVENAEGYFLEADFMDWCTEQYIQSPAHGRNEYAVPLLVEDLTGLPPATVVTAGFDPLRDEGDEYAEMLKADGVEVTHAQYEGMIHGFTSFTGIVEQAEDAIRVAADDLQAAE